MAQSTTEKRVDALRNEMKSRSQVHSLSVDAFIVTSFDEHQTHQSDGSEGRLEFISGYSGSIGDAVVIFISFISIIFKHHEYY